MKLIVDNNLPIALAAHLRSRGLECAHVLDLGLDRSDDLDIWTRAMGDEQIIVSKDEDFLLLASRPGDRGRMIWVRLGNCRNAPLLAAFDRAHEDIVRAIESGQRIIELR